LNDQPVGGTETVLLVNDSPDMLATLAGILRGLGYHTLEASGSVEAQHLAGIEEKIDLLLTDFAIPGANGIELAMWFRALYPATKVLVTSASLWNLGHQVGHNIVFLAKPFTSLELARMVRRVLD
jgi:CheY-like chemotaxis protein